MAQTKVKSETVMIRVSSDFAQILRQEHAKLNEFWMSKTNKDTSFVDYTKMLAKMQSFHLPIFVQLQPIKKGKKSRKVEIDLSELL